MSKSRYLQELRAKELPELAKHITELRSELASLRVQKVSSGSASKVAKIGYVRKQIARALTVMNRMKLQALKDGASGPKSLPKTMRMKKTRAIRRRLTKFEASRKTVRQTKKQAQSFPKLFALN